MNAERESQGTVVVIGGSGFIGSQLIDNLLDKGYNVVNLARHSKEHEDFDNQYHWTEFDLKEGQSRYNSVFEEIHTSYNDVKAVVNLAAYYEFCNNDACWPTYESVNIDSVKQIATALKEQFTDHMPLYIHTSSLAVLKPENIRDNKTDDNNVPTTLYGLSKLKAEEEVTTNFNNYIIFRPSAVYSTYAQLPGLSLLVDAFVPEKGYSISDISSNVKKATIRRFLPGGGNGQMPYVRAETVVDTLISAVKLTDSREFSDMYYISQSSAPKQSELYSKLKEITNDSSRTFNTPVSLVKAGTRLLEIYDGIRGEDTFLQPWMIEESAHHTYVIDRQESKRLQDNFNVNPDQYNLLDDLFEIANNAENNPGEWQRRNKVLCK